MRVLILGGDGMLGYRLFLHLRDGHEVRVTLRRPLDAYESYGLFDRENSYSEVDARDEDRLLEVMADFRPESVVNAVGIVKQRGLAKAEIPSLEINALLPHRLAVMCRAHPVPGDVPVDFKRNCCEGAETVKTLPLKSKLCCRSGRIVKEGR